VGFAGKKRQMFGVVEFLPKALGIDSSHFYINLMG
jgi:hypothetical protein